MQRTDQKTSNPRFTSRILTKSNEAKFHLFCTPIKLMQSNDNVEFQEK